MKSLADVRAFLGKRFENQKAAWLVGQGAWPLTMSLEPPTDREVLADLGVALSWLEGWRRYDGAGHLAWETRAWAKMGTHSVPARLCFGDASSVAHEIGLSSQWMLATARHDDLCRHWPALCAHAVLMRHYRLWHELDEADFARLVHLLQWIERNPSSDCYLRELPVAGLHTKWLESRKALVRDLAIAIGIFPADCEDLETGLGLRRKPRRVRVRILCPELRSRCMGLEDIELPLEHVARLSLDPTTLLIVENQETGLALPDMASTVAIFGLGYSVSLVQHLPWMRSARLVVYWGDIDTHGFAILASVRTIRRDVASVLMDMQAWSVNVHHAAYEKRGAGRFELSLMDDHDRAMLEHLDSLALGPANRLEQERLPWSACIERLRQIIGSASVSSTVATDEHS